MTGMFAVCQP